MSKAFTGGCACGAVRYAIADDPMLMSDCKCRDCQRKSGTGHGSYLTFASRKNVKVQGQATHWDLVGDSGNVKTRAFCPTCGSPLYLTFASMPDLFVVHAASLEDPSRYKPQLVTYTSSGYAWDHIDPALPKFEKMPPGRGVGSAAGSPVISVIASAAKQSRAASKNWIASSLRSSQ